MYICISKKRGIRLSLFYRKDIGKRRVYRMAHTSEPQDEKLQICKFKTLAKCQEMCDEVNRIYNDDYKPEFINKSIF